MIGLSDWHPDIVSFVLCKIQNPVVLDKISKETNNKLISETAEHFLVRDHEGNPTGVIDSEFMTGANISVLISHDFMKAVENDEMWTLRFPDLASMDAAEREVYNNEWQKIGDVREWEKRGHKSKTYYELKATELWHLLNLCARYSAEPGMIFIDECNDMSNSYYYDNDEGRLVVTNPCGE